MTYNGPPSPPIINSANAITINNNTVQIVGTGNFIPFVGMSGGPYLTASFNNWAAQNSLTYGGSYIPQHYRKQLITYITEMGELDSKMKQLLVKLATPVPENEYKIQAAGDDEKLLDEIILHAARLIKNKSVW